MNELDKLRKMLDDAKIPYKSYQKTWDGDTHSLHNRFGEAGKYERNQVIYGKYGRGKWKIDGICQYGSFGAAKGLIETYGELGTDEDGEPMVMTAKEMFEIIKEDWEKENKQ